MEPKHLRLDDQLCFALYAATNAVTRAYRPMLAERGLTYPQYLVMLVLWQDGPSTVGQIASRLRLTHSAVTPLLDRLEQSDLLRRRRVGEDKRVVQIELTDLGAYLENETSLVQQTVECRTGLSESQVAALRADLHAVVEMLESAPPEADDAKTDAVAMPT